MRTLLLRPKSKKSTSFQWSESPKEEKDHELVKVTDVKKGQPFVSLFPMMSEVKASITADMKKNGFDTSQPVIIWKEADVLIDGHTRLASAQSANLTHVAAIYKSFADVDDALRYAYGLQFKRRNLTDADKFHFSETYLNNLGQDTKKGSWKKKELASILSVSLGTAQKYISVITRGSEKEKAFVRTGEKSINSVYNSILTKEKGGASKGAGKQRTKKTNSASFDSDSVSIPIKTLRFQMKYWAQMHHKTGDENSVFEQRIQGVLEVLPKEHPLLVFAKELLSDDERKEE
jgi:hypothetical protein